MKFYTSVAVLGNRILHRWVENGERKESRIEYRPTFYVPSGTPTPFKTLQGDYVGELPQDSIRDAKKFLKQYEDVDGFKVYGDIGFQYQFIADKYAGNIDFDSSQVKIAWLDIETDSETRFGDPENPTEAITAITVKIGNKIKSFAFLDDYYDQDVRDGEDLDYIKCVDETDMLLRFYSWWQRNYPDIISGWNVEFYDVPYIINRTLKILGEDVAKKISPWGFFRDTRVKTGQRGREQQKYVIYGISILDYLPLYKKFAPRGASQDSYKLGDIGLVELSQTKVEYEGTLHELYVNDFQKFMRYNIQDVRLVERLDAKLRLIELVMILAYNSHTNYEDVFFQTRMWDGIIYNFLKAKNIVIPPRVHGFGGQIEGAFVKAPVPGMYDWIVSFDFSSLYPSIIRMLNISPETYRGMAKQQFDLDSMIDKGIDLSMYVENSQAIGANGALFDKTQLGFLPEILEEFLQQRSFYKKQMLKAKGELDKATSPEGKTILENTVAKCNGFQSSIKVGNNSAYGVAANSGFRYYNANASEAITITGQLAIKWMIKKINVHLNKILKTNNIDYVLAADTDSSYLNLGPLVDKFFTKDVQKENPHKIVNFLNKVCEQDIQPMIQKACEELTEYLNGRPGTLDMKRESIASRGFWTRKKKYALNVYDKEGVRYQEPKIEVTGLEIVRSEMPKVVKSKLKEVIKIIMTGTNDEVLEYIDKFKQDFKSLSIEDIAFTKGIYDLGKYADDRQIYGFKTPMHVRAALLYNHWLRKLEIESKYPPIRQSEKVRYIHLRMPNTLHEDVIAFSTKVPKEFGIEKYVDYHTQFQKSFFDPIERILLAIGWQTEWSNALF